MARVLSRARIWLAVPLLAGGLFAFQSQAVANNGHHNARGHSHVENQSHVENHSRTCNTTEEAHENFHAQMHEHEHGCD